MESSNGLVTQDNYREIRAYLDDQIDHYLINMENWVLIRFRRIPPDPSREDIDELNMWISTYLPRRAIRELTRKFGDNRIRLKI
jgi:hypothetical protein